jgi:hypothetical protein
MQPYTYIDGVDYLSAQALDLERDGVRRSVVRPSLQPEQDADHPATDGTPAR